MSPHIFRGEDGLDYIYPIFIADCSGYAILLWNDMDERQERRVERLARDAAEKAWEEHYPNRVRFERRVRNTDYPSGDRRGYISVRFGVDPLWPIGEAANQHPLWESVYHPSRHPER